MNTIIPKRKLTFWGALFCCFLVVYPSSFQFFFPADTQHVPDGHTFIEIQDEPRMDNKDREMVLVSITAQEVVVVLLIFWEGILSSCSSIPAFYPWNPILRC